MSDLWEDRKNKGAEGVLSPVRKHSFPPGVRERLERDGRLGGGLPEVEHVVGVPEIIRWPSVGQNISTS
jgi:hypothetical protein